MRNQTDTRIAISRSTAVQETEDGSYDAGAANGVQTEVHYPDTDADRRFDDAQGHDATRGILLRPVRRRSRTESALTEARRRSLTLRGFFGRGRGASRDDTQCEKVRMRRMTLFRNNLQSLGLGLCN